MKSVLLSVGGLVAVLTLTWAASARGAGSYAAPRTAWGDPDLQGQWGNSQTSTPLERPLSGALAGKETLSDEAAESLEVEHLANGDKPPAEGDPGDLTTPSRSIAARG